MSKTSSDGSLIIRCLFCQCRDAPCGRCGYEFNGPLAPRRIDAGAIGRKGTWIFFFLLFSREWQKLYWFQRGKLRCDKDVNHGFPLGFEARGEMFQNIHLRFLTFLRNKFHLCKRDQMIIFACFYKTLLFGSCKKKYFNYICYEDKMLGVFFFLFVKFRSYSSIL